MTHDERPPSAPPTSGPAPGRRAAPDPDPATEAERERRLDLLEQPGGGGMLQPELPLRDVLVLLVAIVVVSAALLLWVRA